MTDYRLYVQPFDNVLSGYGEIGNQPPFPMPNVGLQYFPPITDLTNKGYCLTYGSTNVLTAKRVIPTSNSVGNPGEYCFGIDPTTNITYLYYCNGVNSWVRNALNSW
jgi:hypothetical protein